MVKCWALKTDAPVCVNLLRGRDSWSGEFRGSLGGSLGGRNGNKHFRKMHATPSLADYEKHRGFSWMVGAAQNMARGIAQIAPGDATFWADEVLRTMQPAFNSYKSKVGGATLVMDSVALLWKLSAIDPARNSALIRPTKKEMQSWHDMRSKRNEGGRKVDFDYQEYVARFVHLKANREKAPEFIN